MSLYYGYTETQKETVIGQEDIIMEDNATISQSAAPTNGYHLTNKKYLDDNRKKLKGIADENINMGYYKIKQTIFSTSNGDIINKNYVDTKITSFDRKIIDLSISADGYYYPLKLQIRKALL